MSVRANSAYAALNAGWMDDFGGTRNGLKLAHGEPRHWSGIEQTRDGLSGKVSSLGTSVSVGENRQLSFTTVRDMQVAVDVAWNSLTPEQQMQSNKTVLATRILDAAAAGERSPARLVRLALMSASGS